MPKKRSHPSPSSHEVSNVYGGTEAALPRFEIAACNSDKSASGLAQHLY